ncbi:MAG: aminotransferase class V-fold PLP-dependent enzyme, partial [Parcubacteria group bacterium]|nr:aminotransferase class V-fold PLP-dependent enzyme [Parcubacteria group bacterium]
MIPLVKSTFYKEAETKRRLVNFIRKAKILSFNTQCTTFEKKFAAWQGRKYCVFVNNGSSANLAIIQTLLNVGKLKKGDSVGFSAITWSTTVMPLLQLGLKPIPIDVNLSTLNVDSYNVRKVLRKHQLKMIFLTNLLGFCDDIETIRDICKREHILLLEDNCESLGSRYRGKLLGNFGIASTNSFYVGHHLSTIEGGAVCTDDEEIATMLKIVRAHGWGRNLTFAKQNQIRKKFNINSAFYSRYVFYDLGYNLRPTEIHGF